MSKILERLRPHLEWVSSAFQALVSALALAWGLWFSVSVFTDANNPRWWIAYFIALLFLAVILYCLLTHAVLVSLRGLQQIKEDEGYEKVEELGWKAQVRILAFFVGFSLVVLPIVLSQVFNAKEAAFLIAWGSLFLFPLMIWLMVTGCLAKKDRSE